MSYLDDLTGKHISVNGVPYPDRKNLQVTAPLATVTDSPSGNATVLDLTLAMQAGLAPGAEPSAYPYAVVEADAGSIIIVDEASQSEVQLGTGPSVGAVIYFHQKGAGKIQFTGAGGCSVYYETGSGLKSDLTIGQYATAGAWRRDSTSWILFGELGG